MTKGREALVAARAYIQSDRDLLVEAHTGPEGLEADAVAFVRDVDALLARLDATLAAAAEPAPAAVGLTAQQLRRLFEFVEETRGYLNREAMSPSLYDEAADMMHMLKCAMAHGISTPEAGDE